MKKAVSLSILCLSLTHCIYWAKKPDFSWPVSPPHAVSRHFSVYHDGVDFVKPTGTAVFSTSDGHVISSGVLPGYGKIIVIRHSYKWLSLYAHLHKIEVKNGQRVKKGQKIGEVGSTGRSSGPHLHFELLYKKDPQNPLRFLPD